MKIKTITSSILEINILDTSLTKTYPGETKLPKFLKVSAEVLGHFLKKELKISRFELSLTLCGNKKIKSLNNDYRNKNKVTDVLSFPVHENLRSDGVIPGLQEVELGDIFICKDVALKQSREFKVSYCAEIIHLLVHGVLHLIGYDHEISLQEEKIMFQLEEKLVKSISLKLKG